MQGRRFSSNPSLTPVCLRKFCAVLDFKLTRELRKLMKILLVEDSPTLRHAMSAYIKSAGHEPKIAETGEAALQYLELHPVDMVIMDVEMPGLNGFETTRLIRESLGDHWIPIIFVTGNAEDKSVEEAIEAGGDDYLVKPVSQIILNAKIRAMERITNMRDQLAKLNAELVELSQRDGLTGLYNRRALLEKAQHQWKLMTRAHLSFSVLLLDIDHFKLFNDSYGHPEGDECIRKVSAVLSNCINRPSDFVGRYGGEEFIVVLADTSESGVAHIAENIRSEVENLRIAHHTSTTSDYVTVSIGGSMIHYTTGTNLDKQIELADKALYFSKHKGRNCVTINEYHPPHNVLVVDDCETTLALVGDSLEGHCSVTNATTGEEAILLAHKIKPDLMLLDIKLPGIDGYEVCNKLREDMDTASIPIILISSSEEEELKLEGKKVRANACLTKPLEPYTLVAKINKFLY